MGVLAGISAVVGIFSALYGIYKATTAPQEQAAADKRQNDIIDKQLKSNEDIANKNFDLSKEQFEYQKQLNELTMQREDTAFQRQVSDLKAAGLSPLMVAGNGATAAPLQSAQAPQFDMSGINQAMTNAIGAYNDSFTRKLQAKQFGLQARAQTAQLYTQIAESVLQQKYIKAQTKYLEDKNEWENTYGYRDYNWKSILTDLVNKFVNNNKNTTIPNLSNLNFETAGINLPSGKQLLDSITNSGNNEPVISTPLPTKKEIEKDLNKIEKGQNKDYFNNSYILMTSAPTEKNLGSKSYMQALNYMHKHTDAWRDFETVSQFADWLKDPDNRSKLREKYPLPSTRRLPWN